MGGGGICLPHLHNPFILTRVYRFSRMKITIRPNLRLSLSPFSLGSWDKNTLAASNYSSQREKRVKKHLPKSEEKLCIRQKLVN